MNAKITGTRAKEQKWNVEIRLDGGRIVPIGANVSRAWAEAAVAEWLEENGMRRGGSGDPSRYGHSDERPYEVYESDPGHTGYQSPRGSIVFQAVRPVTA